MEIIQNILDYLLTNAVSIVLALLKGGIVLFIGWKLAKWVSNFVRKSKAFKKLEGGVASFVGSLIEIILKIIVVISVVSILGINLSAAVTALASCGLTLGLAFQGALSNLAGGFIILVFKPFKVGDYIDTHTDSGEVVSIAIFHTKLRTVDNKIISIPNGSLSNASVINYSALPERRVDFQFGVEYGSDILKVKNILTEIANSQPTKLADKDVECMLGSFGDSQINIILRIWVKTEDYWVTYFNINEQVNEAFGKNGIVVPFPQVNVHTK